MLHRNKSTNITYLITIKIGRYTKEEREILDHIFKNQRAMMRNAMIIFTNRNELMDEDDPADQNVDAWIGKNPNLFKSFSRPGVSTTVICRPLRETDSLSTFFVTGIVPVLTLKCFWPSMLFPVELLPLPSAPIRTKVSSSLVSLKI
jgi:hypothetical protein